MENWKAPSPERLIAMDPGEVPSYLGSGKEGLTAGEAEARLRSAGRNEIASGRPPSLLSRALHLIADPFSLLLLLAGTLSVIGGIVQLGAVIFIIVALNAALSVLQEWRVERVMQTLREWLPQASTVLRDGELTKVPASDLVPGDVVQVEEGDRIPADARLIESYGLWTNNVPLTGESAPQSRTSAAVGRRKATLTASPNLLFMGTSVARGRGVAVVHSTGMRTRFGEIASLTSEVRPAPSPMQAEIARAARYDFVIALAVGTTFFFLGSLLFRLDIYDSLLLMIGVIVACVPEGLQLTISTALAISLLELGRHNVLVKGLASVQTLGSVTVICTDKTGTITRGEMTVTEIWAGGTIIDVSGTGYSPEGDLTVDGRAVEGGELKVLTLLLERALLCSTARVYRERGRWSVVGDPTEGALLVAAMKLGLDPEAVREEHPLTAMLPFDAVRRSMTTFHRADGGGLACVKGAPDSVLPACRAVLTPEGVVDLDEARRKEAEAAAERLAARGLRMIAVAYRPMDAPIEEAQEVNGLVLAGLAGMYDPPRPEVLDGVRTSRTAGVRTIIVTGDYGPTALVIAREVGLAEGGEPRVIEGGDLDAMDDDELRTALEGPNLIFARATPYHKRRIVRTLKAMGEVVAVTGDGANDAPSLKEADIGVAMGASGTDVAREASDMVLLDDSYSSIVTAVRLGRGIYDNIRKFLTYVFSHNWAELIPYVLFGLLAIPLPLLAVQILAIDLIIDVPPSLALSREPPEPKVMERPPRSASSRLFDLDFLARSVILGAVIATGAMLACFHVWMEGGWSLGESLPSDSLVYMRGTTMVFAGIVVAQMANLLGSRTLDAPIHTADWQSNPWIYAGLAWMVGTLMLIIYLPPLQPIFGTAPLRPEDWGILSLIAVAVLFTDAGIKKVARYRTRRADQIVG
ncbi:MAG: cation-transporting P-type ATPase [Methanomassiliicoccus sp.]|nr:cation-transporting P-type ATPase [Methanomassiliicoccus sp.]